MRNVYVFEVEYGLCVRPASGSISSAEWLTLYWTQQNTQVGAGIGHFVLILYEMTRLRGMDIMKGGDEMSCTDISDLFDIL